MIEQKLSTKIEDWLIKKGYKTKIRFRFGNNIEIDIYATKNNITKGIEIKVDISPSQLNKAIIQILKFKPYVDYTYLATPIKPDLTFNNICKTSGIGILVITDEIQEILSPEKNKQKIKTPSLSTFRTNDIGHYIEKEWLLLPTLLTIFQYENKTISTGFIAGLTNISQQTASRHINLAVERGYLEKKSHGSYYSYTLTNHSKQWLHNISKQIQELLTP